MERLCGSPQQIVLTLDGRGYKHAYVDGGLTVQSFLDAGLIQRMTITRVPVIIGSGIPLFGQPRRTSGCVMSPPLNTFSGLVKSDTLVRAK